MEVSPKSYKELRLLVYISLALGIISGAVAIATFLQVQDLNRVVFQGATQVTTVTGSGTLVVPPLSLADAPVISLPGPPGQRLTGINAPFSSSELAVINNASDAYFQTAGLMLLNGSIQNRISGEATPISTLLINGKPSVMYLGAISCIFCGENRWAMALALGRFGSFTHLFKGYSALGDGGVPTIFWRPDEYNASSSVDLGNFYTSSYVNFLSIEYSSPIQLGFQMQTLSFILHQAQLSNSEPYVKAVGIIINANNYAGTPYTIWGGLSITHADAVIFGNSTTASPSALASLTHEVILSKLNKPQDQFTWSEYAAADVYIAALCSSLHNIPSVCGLSAIMQIQKAGGY